MQDTIIKGSGNSRTLASVPNFLTLYPTYEAFAQALINRELPIDLGPINPAGVDVHGTDLIKSTLLKDTTAALYGKTSAATPDDILAAIRPLITAAQSTANSKGLVQCGSYIGSGTYGEQNPNTLSFNFPPSCVFLVGVKNRSDGTVNPIYNGAMRSTVVMAAITTNYKEGCGFGLHGSNGVNNYAKKSPDGKTLYWYIKPQSGYNYPSNQYNDDTSQYYWVAVG